jgi:hypothetical protein
MKVKNMNFEIYKREAIFAELKQFCHLAKEHDFIEVTEWNNGEGWDVTINTTSEQNISITYGQFDAIKKLIKQLEK